MPKLLVLSQYFPPEMGAPQARLSELGTALVSLGWQVEILTALPNYPTGRVFAGYRAFRPHVERVAGMRTVRVPVYAAQIGFARRLANYSSFVASATVLGPPRLARPDLLFVESPPLFIGLAALALSRWWRVPYVFNVSDLWPESAVRMGVVAPGLATRLAERLELRLYRSAAAVTGQSTEIVSSITGRVPGKPALVVTNGVDPERFGPTRVTERARALTGPEPGPVFTYAGLLGLAQGLDQILDLARALPPGIPGRFVLVGDGPVRSRLAARIEQERLTRVRLVPAQPAGEIPALLAASDVAIISLGMHLPGAVPSKIYEAMASALPILLIADGEARDRVEAAGAGLVVPPHDPATLIASFERLAIDGALRQQLGRAGRRAAETGYNRAQIARQLSDFLRRFVPAGGLARTAQDGSNTRASA